MKTKLILIITAIALISAGCCRKIGQNVSTHTSEVTHTVVRDSIYIHKPDTIIYKDSIRIEIIYLPDTTATPQDHPQPPATSIKLTTDTLWAKGKYGDAWAVVRNNRLYAGMIEGKEFDILLKNLTTQIEHLKTKETVKEVVVEVKKTPWVLYGVIALLIASIVLMIKFRR